jgi:uncharacterized phage protein (TIGR01671 family)
MPREIKFRIYRKGATGKQGMTYFSLNDIDVESDYGDYFVVIPFPNTKDIYIHELPQNGLSQNDDLIIMQYIGKKDKSGKEIYEGDIVTHPLCVKEPHDLDTACETFVGCINFEVDRGQYFAVNMKVNGYVIVMTEAYKFEVIGNIYENPELLEKDKC